MWFFLLVFVLVSGYNAIQDYNETARYNFSRGDETPFFQFMLFHHPFVTISSVILFGLLVFVGFS